VLEQTYGNGCYRRPMRDVYLPTDWPEAVAPPGSQDWEASAVEFPVKFICSADPDLQRGLSHNGPVVVDRKPLNGLCSDLHASRGS
jgi:hypothetical protein